MTSSQKGITLDSHRILILSAEGSHRENMRAALMQMGYNVSFSSALSDAFDLLMSIKPQILIHDWTVADASQSAAFEQRLARHDDFQKLIRILLCPNITPQVLGIAHDTGIRRVLSHATSNLSLGNEIEMAKAADSNMSELQKFARDLRSNSVKYEQSKVDSMVEKAWGQFSHDPVVKVEFGNLCLRRQEYDRSKQIASELLQADESNVRAMNLMARSLMKEGRFQDAVGILERANNLSPKNSDRLIDLGNCFFKTGNHSKAKECYTEALAAGDDSKEAKVGLGRIVLTEGDVNAALKLFTEGVSEDEAASYFNTAAIQAVREGRMEEAMKLYETALAALQGRGNKAIIHYNIALWHKKQNQLEEAMRSLRRCLKLDPTNVKAQAKLREVENALKV